MYYEWLCLGCLLGAELYLGIALYLMVLHWYCLITSMFKWSWMIVPGVFDGGRLRGVAANGYKDSIAVSLFWFISLPATVREEIQITNSPITKFQITNSTIHQITRSPIHQYGKGRSKQLLFWCWDEGPCPLMVYVKCWSQTILHDPQLFRIFHDFASH